MHRAMSGSYHKRRSFENRRACHENNLPESIYEQSIEELGVLLGVLEQDHPELVTIVSSWPHLPEHIQQAIITLIEAATQGDSANE